MKKRFLITIGFFVLVTGCSNTGSMNTAEFLKRYKSNGKTTNINKPYTTVVNRVHRLAKKCMDSMATVSSGAGSTGKEVETVVLKRISATRTMVQVNTKRLHKTYLGSKYGYEGPYVIADFEKKGSNLTQMKLYTLGSGGRTKKERQAFTYWAQGKTESCLSF